MSQNVDVLIQNISECVLATILIIGGFFIGLYGNKLHKAILFLLGFIAGSLLIYFLAHNIGITTDAQVLCYSLIIAFIIGLCCGCLTLWVYNTALFVIGAITGMIIAQSCWHLIMGWFPDIVYPEIYNIIIVFLFAIIFGFIAVKFIGVVVKPLTAFIGSYMVISGTAYFVQKYIIKEDGDNVIDVAQFFEPGNECNAECYIFLGVWIFWFTLCLLYQYEVCSNDKRVTFHNVEEQEGISDFLNEEVEDSLLQDV